MLLWFSFILFITSVIGMAWMVFRLFPELSQVTVVHHKHFSFLGIENVHVLEYKAPAEIFWKNVLISLEKTLRRLRSAILKLDNLISRGIERVQAKNQAMVMAKKHEHAEAMPEDVSPTYPIDLHAQAPQITEKSSIENPVQHIHVRQEAPKPRRQYIREKKAGIDIRPPGSAINL